jgi:mannose-1-phosphate guanylyltransferase/mannose-6-phosphate isomerase
VLIPVILSGGAGTRLWPVSRRTYPKPFMQVGNGGSLLERTVQRAHAISSQGPIYTVTHEDHYFLTRDAYGPLGKQENFRYLLEPCGRNTAPAIAMAALAISRSVQSDAIVLVLPADHLIEDLEGFKRAVDTASALARDHYLVTFGIRPTRPDTGFGYIRMGQAMERGYRIDAFVEKPDRATAASYLASGHYLWNSGMFAFRADALLEAMQRHAPEVMAAVERVAAHIDWHQQPTRFDPALFAELPDISIDYAVMEHATRRAVVPASFDWNDIGNWKAVSELGDSDAHGNRVEGSAVLIDSHNCYVQASRERTVALVGLNDVVVVDTEDAVLITHRERAQDVKQVTEQLTRARHEAANVHRTVRRPWGSYTVLEDSADCKVKRLVVNPGHILSLQMHHRRSEHWTVVCGTARVTVGDRTVDLQRNQSIEIPVETRHRLENATAEPIALIEVQCGDYFGEDDIVRFEDRYGRS